MRFGKPHQVFDAGLCQIPPPGSIHHIFTGSQTLKTNELHINDRSGTPIRVSAVYHYRVTDAVKDSVQENESKILMNRAEGATRDVCRSYAMIAEDGDDLRNGSTAIQNQLRNALQTNTEHLGITIDSAHLAEVNYAPEIAQSMLMKQQAAAVVAARKEIVEGVVQIVKETTERFPELSAEEKGRLTTNLLTTLASSATPQPVIPLK